MTVKHCRGRVFSVEKQLRVEDRGVDISGPLYNDRLLKLT